MGIAAAACHALRMRCTAAALVQPETVFLRLKKKKKKKDVNVPYLAVCRTAAIYFGSDSSTVIFATDRKMKTTEYVSSADDPFQCISSVHMYGRSLYLSFYSLGVFFFLPSYPTTHASSLITALSCAYRLQQRERERSQGVRLIFGLQLSVLSSNGGT